MKAFLREGCNVSTAGITRKKELAQAEGAVPQGIASGGEAPDPMGR